MPARAAHIADAGFSLRSLKLAAFPPFSKARKQRPLEVEPLECCDGGGRLRYLREATKQLGSRRLTAGGDDRAGSKDRDASGRGNGCANVRGAEGRGGCHPVSSALQKDPSGCSEEATEAVRRDHRVPNQATQQVGLLRSQGTGWTGRGDCGMAKPACWGIRRAAQSIPNRLAVCAPRAPKL